MNEPCLCGALDCRACRGADARPDDDDCDITSETLELVREWLDDAENAHNAGNDDKARQCLREVIAALEEFADEVTT